MTDRVMRWRRTLAAAPGPPPVDVLERMAELRRAAQLERAAEEIAERVARLGVWWPDDPMPSRRDEKGFVARIARALWGQG